MIDNRDKYLISEEEFLSLVLAGQSKSNIFSRYRVSIEFLKKYSDTFNDNDWIDISAEQYLTEKFIREFKDKVDWMAIAETQKLSLKFRKEFKYKLFPWDET